MEAPALLRASESFGLPNVTPRFAAAQRRFGPNANESTQAYIGVSRTTFSTLASSTVSFDKCSSAATCAAVI
jgi:hypothetical protein